MKRIVTELYDYHERVTNLQYLPTEEEAYFIAKNCPIQIAGDPTEKREVSNYKDLSRIESDFIRGGFCLAISSAIIKLTVLSNAPYFFSNSKILLTISSLSNCG